MSYTKFYSAIGLAFAAVICSLGWMYLAPAHGESQKSVCILLIDRTGSSFDPATQASYKRLAHSAVEGCRAQRATLAVYYFDNTSAKLLRAGDQLYRLYRPPTHRARLGEEKVRREMRRAEAAVASVFDTPIKNSVHGHGSDIVTAVSLASQSLQQAAAQAGVSNKYLVVLTDGYQTGRELGARANFRSPDAAPDEVVAKARDLALVPTLNGVKTSFVGVGGGLAGARAKTPAWFEAKVRAFWTGLVQEGGGRMCMYNLEPIGLPGEC